MMLKVSASQYGAMTAGEESGHAGCSPWWLLCAVSFLIGAAGIVAINFLKFNTSNEPYEYGLVFDAGSSHTQLYLYQWAGSKENGTAIANQIWTSKQEPGISSYVDSPNNVSKALQMLLDGAMQKIPTNKHGKTPVFLGATAGMRLLEARDKKASDALMEAVRRTLNSSSFQFTHPSQQARILDGREEGSFSWVTVNYLSGNFGKFSPSQMTPFEQHKTEGALDMGGASTQITFIPENASAMEDPKYSEDLHLYGYQYTVYTHSYLCYGLNEAMRRLKANLVNQAEKTNGTVVVIENPCEPKGAKLMIENSSTIFEAPCSKGPQAIEAWGSEIIPMQDLSQNVSYQFNGTSDGAACQKEVSRLFNFTSCKYSRCAFNGQYQPPVYGDFLAFSGFYYPVNFFNLTNTTSGKFRQDKFKQALDSFCNKTWDQVKHLDDPKLLKLYCFEGLYTYTLLTQGYGFNGSNWDRLTFKLKLDGSDLGWSLGFMLNTSNVINEEEKTSEPISVITYGLLMALFVIFLLLAIGFAWHARRRSSVQTKGYQQLPQYGSV